MKQLLDQLADAYLQYLKAAFNPYLILLGVILVVLIFLVFWLIKKLSIFFKDKEVKNGD